MPKEISSVPPEFLTTNYIPCPEECQLIRNFHIPNHEQRCLALDDQVRLAERALAALQNEQRTQHELLYAHKAMLTPMRRLLPELLLKIFRHCLDDFVEAPMRLCRVCQKWRELVLSTPTLWTRIVLQDTMGTQRIVPFTRACVAYSGSLPIKVVLKFMHRRNNIVRRAIFDVWETLIPHIHRWQAFEVYMDNMWKPNYLLKLLPSNAPLVEKLVLRMDRSLPLPFSHLPSLRDLILSVPARQDIPMLLQCTRLRTLSIGSTSCSGLTLMNCWVILSNCPDIEVFNIPGILYDITPLPMNEITLSRLRDLRIGPCIPDPGPLIHCIKTPALQRLCLLVSQDIDWSCVTRLVQECRPPLTCLSLVNAKGTDVAQCIPFLPNLTTLTLQHTESIDAVLNSLTEQEGDGAVNCPALVHFCLRLCTMTPFAMDHLIRLATERRRVRGGVRLLLDKKTVTDHISQDPDVVAFTIEISSVSLTDLQMRELHNLQNEST